jgi:hypothetical protein
MLFLAGRGGEEERDSMGGPWFRPSWSVMAETRSNASFSA